ncbi:hypothetical protein NE237_014097 [Protea cynaroides]|uniref:Uncharacterized protein n=1 Tax=Protea cynaroides TaxID=273540 RepID=A0A9Q0H164_9MAGN|nr:hypothetical protein NE237_014097 [Protea cynaroides]
MNGSPIIKVSEVRERFQKEGEGEVIRRNKGIEHASVNGNGGLRRIGVREGPDEGVADEHMRPLELIEEEESGVQMIQGFTSIDEVGIDFCVVVQIVDYDLCLNLIELEGRGASV